MAIKDILVLLDSSSETVGAYALTCASALGAHLTAATLVFDPAGTVGFGEVPSSYLLSLLDEETAAARELLKQFSAAAQNAGVLAETEVIEVSFETPQEALGQFVRPFDVAMVEQPNPGVPSKGKLVIEAALFGSGRPVVVVPYIHKAPFSLKTVLVAWDGSTVAARAIGDAMPFLEDAETVQVVTIDDARHGEPDLPSLAITRHLARHGIKAELKTLSNAGDVASTLLSHAADSSADLLVMGGYGHSRFREFVLGGATRGILEAMTLPVLMSH